MKWDELSRAEMEKSGDLVHKFGAWEDESKTKTKKEKKNKLTRNTEKQVEQKNESTNRGVLDDGLRPKVSLI